MAYTIGNPVKLGSGSLEQVISVDVTLDTSTSGTVPYPFSSAVPLSDVTFNLQNMGAVACVASINLASSTTTNIALLSNGTAGVYRLYFRTQSQAG
jgi:hypothetical protein